MPNLSPKIRLVIVVLLVALISALDYWTHETQAFQRIFYRELYFLPLIMAGFWFGLRGGMATSLAITAIYLPFVVTHYEANTPTFFADLMEIVLFNVVAAVLGRLRDQEQVQQKMLRRAESLAAMGRAISAVAHDMKTPLMAIGGFTAQVRKKLSPEDSAGSAGQKLDMVIRQTARLESMVREMLDFSHPLNLHRGPGDLAQVVAESLAVVSELASRRHVRLEFSTEGDLTFLNFDAPRLQQALINLVGNAVEASPTGEVVTVCAARRGQDAWLEVGDHGEGVPPEQREEIFTPFFTTKREGTGLGLPILKKIVKSHGGRVDLVDNHPRGMIFRLVLPKE